MGILGITDPTCAAQSASQSPCETLGENLDAKIARTRKHLEKLCITKAKAEAMQMLNTPMDFLGDCMDW